MALKLIAAATALPISLIEAKAHMRIDASTDDTLITAMITAAGELAEQKTGRALTAQTWELTLDAFPVAFELAKVPVSSVTSLTYIDINGDSIVLGSSNYSLDNACDYGHTYVVPAYGVNWPATRAQINAVALRFVAGYTTVPESIKAWIKLQVGAMYENREREGAMQTHALGFADSLLDRYKVYG